MKHRVLGPLTFAILLVGCVAAASAQGGNPCSNARAAGAYGYTKTGTIYLPTGDAAPFGSTGTFVLEADGTMVGTQSSSVAGSVGEGVMTGTFAIGPDCIGTMTVSVYDQSGNLLRTLSMALVVDDRGSELRSLVTSLVLPNGVVLPAVMTGQARRLFPKGDDE